MLVGGPRGVSSWHRALFRNVVHAPALRYRDFRLLCVSSTFDSVGFMGENVALGWVVLTLTDSPLMVGVALGLRHAPSFFLGLVAGAIADTRDRRTLLRALDVGSAAVTLAIGLLLLSDDARLWQLLALTTVGGALSTMNMTARQSFAYDIVGPDNVLSGLAYVSLGMRLGGTVGALAAGLVLGWAGPGYAYLMLAAGYLASAVVLTTIRSRGQSAPVTRQPVLKSLTEFGIEIRRNRTLLWLVVIVGAVEVLGFSTQALLPSIARDVLEVGPEGLGIMGAFSSAGGVLAMVLLSPLGEIRRTGLAFIGVLHVLGLSLLLLATASSFYVAILAVLAMSSMMALSDLFSQSLIQRSVPNELRGRAMGAWMVAVGTAPVGNLQIGALASAFGVAFALASHGIGLVVLAAMTLALSARLRRL